MTEGVKYDEGLLQYSLISPIAMREVARVHTMGAAKYSPNGWRKVPDAPERYLNALYRHLEAYRLGEKVDSESGLSHLSHLATNALFLIELENLADEQHESSGDTEELDIISLKVTREDITDGPPGLSDRVLAGERLMTLSEVEGLNVKCLYWRKHDNQWKLVIVSPQVDKQGPKAYYELAINAEWFHFSDEVVAIGPSECKSQQWDESHVYKCSCK